MIECKNCKAELEDDAKFCPECGNVVETEAASAEAAPVEATVAEQSEEAPKKSNGVPKKAIFGIAAAAAVVVLIVIIAAIFSGTKKTSMLIYQKDNQLNFTYASKVKPFEVTEDMLAEEIASATPSFVITNNAKTIFFSEETNGVSYDLYYRNLKKPKKEATKLASDVTAFEVSANGKTVYFTSGGNLYSHNLKDKTKVDEDVTSFWITEDAKQVLYKVFEASEDGGESYLYYKKGKKEAKKLASGISDVSFSEDFKYITYLKEDALYTIKKFKDPVKVASEVGSYYLCEDNSIFFVKEEDKSIKYSELINDNMKEADETTPSYGSEDYYNHRTRNRVRNLLSQEGEDAPKFEYSVKTLYFYDGKKETAVAEGLDYIRTGSLEENILFYSVNKVSEPKKVDISVFTQEIGGYESNVKYYFEDQLESDKEYYFAFEKKAVKFEVEDEDFGDYALNHDASVFYYVEDETLYSMKVKSNKLGKKSKYDSDVYSVMCPADSESVVYFKDYNEEKKYADLYIDKKKVDSDVYCPYGSFSYVDVLDKKIAYLVDYNDEKQYGQLKYFNGRKASKIADDVYYTYIVMLPDGKVAYLADYNKEKGYGTLFLSNGKKSTKVADDVQRVFPYYYSESNKIASYNN
ncbi:MAG: zinc ribbon domain-containing protein [Lachnospira sp.]|nr:zinc ribbon domain-containing protein [Lachnospira sp.]